MRSFSRISAAFTLFVVFILIIAVAIVGIQFLGTQITHGDMIEHTHGMVLKSNIDNSLEFQPDSGQAMHFTCSGRCLTQLGHIQRHIREHAPTDVYYKQENDTYVAVDVD